VIPLIAQQQQQRRKKPASLERTADDVASSNHQSNIISSKFAAVPTITSAHHRRRKNQSSVPSNPNHNNNASSNVTPSKFPAALRLGGANFPWQRRKKEKKMANNSATMIAGEANKVTASATEPVTTLLHVGPPMAEYDDDSINETSYQDHEDEDDLLILTRPGAYPVAGINARQVSQLTIVYGEQEHHGAAAAPATSMMEEDHHHHHHHHVDHTSDVTTMEAAATVVQKNDDLTLQRFCATNKKAVIIATILLAVAIAAAIIGVLVSQSHHKKKSTIAGPPTVTATSLIQTFRSVLLDYNVSSSQDLNRSGTPQNDALNWLVNFDTFLNESSSVESIIDRYVLAVLYYADDGYNWNDPSDFLTLRSICDWHDRGSLHNNTNGIGAFCTTLLHASNGKSHLFVTVQLSYSRNSKNLTFGTLCL
jgi:hypothetical protein